MAAEIVTLESLADGAAAELWGAALAQVLENLDDPNTDWKPKRRISLTFDFSTDEERRVGEVVIGCTTKLSGIRGVKHGVYYGKRQGVLALVQAPRQEDLFTDPNPARPRAVEPASGGAQ